MPKFYEGKIEGCDLYFTSLCILEAFHAHASDNGMRRRGAAKFFIFDDGTSSVEMDGKLSKKQISAIQVYIKRNHIEMLENWNDFAKSRGMTPGTYKKR